MLVYKHTETIEYVKKYKIYIQPNLLWNLQVCISAPTINSYLLMEIHITCLLQILSFASRFGLFEMKHGMIGVHSPPTPQIYIPPWYQSSRSPSIYLVGLLAISDTHINIYVGPPNTCIALKQFNLLFPNTLFWSNFIYYPLTHRFEAITLGWIKTCVKWFWDNLTETDKLRLES